MAQYSRDQLKICIAKMCLTIGWHSSMTTPIEILTDIVSNYLYQLGRATTEYANGFGLNHSNVDHLGLVFRDFHISLSELEEYVKNVDCVEPTTILPKYPISKEDHLNFLKPGSKEVVTRQVHIHEHLPPMHPVLEVNQAQAEMSTSSETTQDVDVENTSPVFKRPPEMSRPRLLLEDEGRPTREISSVMMTTSGFLSPAREGKLPESRTPMPALEPIVLPPALPPEASDAQPIKKIPKTTKKLEKKKGKVGKELFKPLADQKPPKKSGNIKDAVKNKSKHASNPQTPLVQNFALLNDVINPSLVTAKTSPNAPQKFNKALAAARLKTEKLNTTITPIVAKTPVAPAVVVKAEPHVDKLFTEPDKRKINILKKISVKNEKLNKPRDEIKQESRESSPDLIIDESANDVANKVHHLSNDLTIELVDIVDSVGKNQDTKPERLFYDESPPGTPSTPKTPEMISQSPPLNKIEKRKRKDKSKIKKIQKLNSPARLDHNVIDIDMERPKTPEARLVMAPEKTEIPAPSIPFPFFPSFPGPSLIPPPLGKSLFSHLGIPPLSMTGFGQTPYISPVHSNVPMNFMHSIKQEEVMQKSPQPSKPATITNPASSSVENEPPPKLEKKNKEHKKDKKDKLKKKNKKDKIKNKAEKKKLKEEKKDKEKIKKDKREKRKEKEVREVETIVPKLTLKLGSPSPHSDSTETRKLERKERNIKPIIKKEEEPIENKDIKREMSPELAKISALVTGQPKPKSTNTVAPTKEESVKEEVAVNHTLPSPRVGPCPGRPRIHPIKPKPSKLNKQQQHQMVKDAVGNTVWYCPACGKQDDGSPMIGCDDCDAWYHWVCVGIQIPPDESENWYCRNCISKKQEVLQTDKKKKRKKREKKEH